MTNEAFNAAIADDSQPTIIDVWAPWCGPCKAMKPIFDALSTEYADRARVIALNADEHPELAKQLNIYGIPTVVAFRGGNEVGRRMGAQSEGDLRGLFDAVLEGRAVPRLTNRMRIMRIVAAVAAAALSSQMTPAWPLQALAAALFVAAIHDRCPIIGALKSAVVGAVSRKPLATPPPDPRP